MFKKVLFNDFELMLLQKLHLRSLLHSVLRNLSNNGVVMGMNDDRSSRHNDDRRRYHIVIFM